MIAHLSEEPITKVTLNLFTKDVKTFHRHYGHGWSTEIRDLVRKKAAAIRREE